MMRSSIRMLTAVAGSPVGAAALASLIVLAFGVLAASKLPHSGSDIALGHSGYSAPMVEHVMAAPKLELNVPAPAATPAPAPGSGTPDSVQIERVGQVSLYVGNVNEAVSSLMQVARGQRGDVLSLEVNNDGAQQGDVTSSLDIRVPAARFDRTMTAVGRIGKVRRRSVSAQDVTTDITDSSARLRNLRRTEADIRKIMDRSGTVTQVLQAENQLSQVREQIETLESSLASLHTRVVYSTISVTLQAEASNAPVEPTAAAQLATAWRAALHALSQSAVGFAAMLLWFVVFTPYIAVAALVAWVVYAQLRKRLIQASRSAT